MSRRKRSEMKRRDCIKALDAFAVRVERMIESSDGCHFSGPNVVNNTCQPGFITVSFLVRGSFGAGDDLHEAIRILSGHKIAADDARPRKKRALT